MLHSTHLLGKAGEHMVAAQFLLRGIPVYFPAVDGGADLIVGENIRIQVKASRRRALKDGGSTGYNFNVSTSKFNKDRARFYKAKRDWTKFVDFFVFWGVDENRFWIAPASLVANIDNIHLGFPVNFFTVNQQEVLALKATGMNQRDVARQLGISEMSVSRAVRGLSPLTKPGPSLQVGKLENAWHLIIGAVSLVNTIDGTPSVGISEGKGDFVNA